MGAATLGVLAVIAAVLLLLNRKVGRLMAQFDTLKTILDAIQADVDTLVSQPPAVITQAQLDEAVAEAQAIKVKTAALVAAQSGQ